jgi:hypothetical protein
MQVSQLRRALHSFLKTGGIDQLAAILVYASDSGKITYEQVQEIVGADFEDSLLLAIQQRLLVPVGSIKGTLDWDDSVLLFRPGECYKMPNVIKCLVEDSCQSGEWRPSEAVARIFRDIGEPNWETMPAVVEKMGEKAQHHILNAFDIVEVCTDSGLADRVDPMIAELKGTGVMSPKLAVVTEGLRARAPIYELNPSVTISAAYSTE